MKLPNASKQILLSMLRNEINFEQEHLEYTKTETKYFYDLSDKNNPNTIEYFESLNMHRDFIRKSKKRIKQLAKISKELKLSLKE